MRHVLRCLLSAVAFAISPALFVETGNAQPLESDLFAAVVGVEARVPADARTARSLGTERGGNGVVIDAEGLVLTIGYLILEADEVEVVVGDRRVPATIIAYDYDTGFGLLRAVAPLGVSPIALGDSSAATERTAVLVAGRGGAVAAQRAMVVSRREFAGYWEYLLDDAIFTAPPYPEFGGAALIAADGRLIGIGSLVVNDAIVGDAPLPGNMFVPINLLKPIFADLLSQGRAAGPARPWLGMFTGEFRGHLFVTRVSPGGPAERAGIVAGDIVVSVGGEGVVGMAELFRAVWALGTAGVGVPLTVVQGGAVREFVVHSADRYDYLRLNPSH